MKSQAEILKIHDEIISRNSLVSKLIYDEFTENLDSSKEIYFVYSLVYDSTLFRVCWFLSPSEYGYESFKTLGEAVDFFVAIDLESKTIEKEK